MVLNSKYSGIIIIILLLIAWIFMANNINNNDPRILQYYQNRRFISYIFILGRLAC